jgi:hypothetical protein
LQDFNGGRMYRVGNEYVKSHRGEMLLMIAG